MSFKPDFGRAELAVVLGAHGEAPFPKYQTKFRLC
jgi:hypothetical protein